MHLVIMDKLEKKSIPVGFELTTSIINFTRHMFLYIYYFRIKTSHRFKNNKKSAFKYSTDRYYSTNFYLFTFFTLVAATSGKHRKLHIDFFNTCNRHSLLLCKRIIFIDVNISYLWTHNFRVFVSV